MKGKELLNTLVAQICELTNNKQTKEEVIKLNLSKFLQLEYASAYGGYRLISVNTENYRHESALPGMSSSEGRKNLKTMEVYLRGIIIGLEYSKAR